MTTAGAQPRKKMWKFYMFFSLVELSRSMLSLSSGLFYDKLLGSEQGHAFSLLPKYTHAAYTQISNAVSRPLRIVKRDSSTH